MGLLLGKFPLKLRIPRWRSHLPMPPKQKGIQVQTPLPSLLPAVEIPLVAAVLIGQ